MTTQNELQADPRQRAFDAAMALLQQQGYYRINMDEVAAQANVGSDFLNQQFPGGKEQLICEAVRAVAPDQLKRMETILMQAPDTPSALEAMFNLGSKTIRASGNVQICPLAVLALENAMRSPALQEVCTDGIQRLSNIFRQRLQSDGIPADRLQGLAMLISTVFEGSFITSRAYADCGTVDLVGQQLADLLRCYIHDQKQS